MRHISTITLLLYFGWFFCLFGAYLSAITNTVNPKIVKITSEASNVLIITGGTFSSAPSVSGYASGSSIGTVADNGDGTWTVE